MEEIAADEGLPFSTRALSLVAAFAGIVVGFVIGSVYDRELRVVEPSATIVERRRR
jgi:hypothetical protein